MEIADLIEYEKRLMMSFAENEDHKITKDYLLRAVNARYEDLKSI